MKEKVVESLPMIRGMRKSELLDVIEIPKNPEMGDYAFPCFSLSKVYKKNPAAIAQEVYSKIKLDKAFDRAEVKGPYINFYIDKGKVAYELLEKIGKEGNDYGKKKANKNKTMIEFSQANTHKAFHIGHVRGTSLGESIARIMEFNGDKVIRANYQGDTGMHVAKWLWCYLNYHKKHKLQENEEWIAYIYVDATRRLAETEAFEYDVKEINKKLESRKDKKLVKLWKESRKLSLDSFEKIYHELNTGFDEYFFESEMEKEGKKVIKALEKMKVAEVSDGAVIVDLNKYGLGIWVLLRSDGTVLYSAKDLALAEKKFKEYKINKGIVVTAMEQDLHFRQLIKTLHLMKFKHKEDYRHLSYGMVRFPWGKMSSRTGDNILYSSFKKELVELAIKELEKRYKLEAPELSDRALAIAISALKYSILKQDAKKNIIFNKEEAMRFEGDTGPYLLYSYARALSILGKAEYKKGKEFEVMELEEQEKRLISELNWFKEIVEKAYNDLDPSGIANYSYDLAKTFNEFYHNCIVIGSEQEQFRLKLVESFAQVLKNALHLLGINVIAKM